MYRGHAIEKIISLWVSLIKVTIGSDIISGLISTLRISPKPDVTIRIVGFIHLTQLQIKLFLFLKIIINIHSIIMINNQQFYFYLNMYIKTKVYKIVL